MLVGVLVAPLPIQVSAYDLGKHPWMAEVLESLHPVGDSEKTLGSCLQISSTLSIEEDLPLLSVNLPFNKNKEENGLKWGNPPKNPNFHQEGIFKAIESVINSWKEATLIHTGT